MMKPAKQRDNKTETPAKAPLPPDPVEEASEESFPASDSPGWILEEAPPEPEGKKPS